MADRHKVSTTTAVVVQSPTATLRQFPIMIFYNLRMMRMGKNFIQVKIIHGNLVQILPQGQTQTGQVLLLVDFLWLEVMGQIDMLF